MNNKPTHKLYGITPSKSDRRGFWTQLGVAFTNSDGSLNLKFNYLPTDPGTTLQLRPWERAEPEAPAEPAQVAPQAAE